MLTVQRHIDADDYVNHSYIWSEWSLVYDQLIKRNQQQYFLQNLITGYSTTMLWTVDLSLKKIVLPRHHQWLAYFHCKWFCAFWCVYELLPNNETAKSVMYSEQLDNLWELWPKTYLNSLINYEYVFNMTKVDRDFMRFTTSLSIYCTARLPFVLLSTKWP